MDKKPMIDCPIDGRKNIDGNICPQCDTDLTPLLRLRELPEAYYAEGVSLRKKDKIDEAIEKMITALNLNNEFLDAHIELANLYMQQGLYEDATAQYKKVLEINLDNDNAKKGLEEIKTLNSQAGKKEKRKRRLAFAGVGSIIFVAGILVIFFFQSIIKTPSIQPPIVPPHPPINNPEHEEIKVTYIIQQGDSLSKIAKEKYGTTVLWPKIYEVNKDKIKDPSKLYVGQELTLREILISPR